MLTTFMIFMRCFCWRYNPAGRAQQLLELVWDGRPIGPFPTIGEVRQVRAAESGRTRL